MVPTSLAAAQAGDRHRLGVGFLSGQTGRVIRDLVTYPCQDACGELLTKRTVDGAPVYRCPGCDSEWYDEAERTVVPGAAADDRGSPEPSEQGR